MTKIIKKIWNKLLRLFLGRSRIRSAEADYKKKPTDDIYPLF